MTSDHGIAHPDAPAQAPIMLDLTACDREMVQYPGAIMPHGLLFVLSPGDHRVLGASANAVHRLGGGVGALANAALEGLIEAAALPIVEQGLAQLAAPAPPRYLGCVGTPWSGGRFDLFAHRSGNTLLLEFEAAADDDSAGDPPAARFAAVTQAIVAVQAAETWQAGMDVAARELKRLTGFDSVVANRFLEDGSFQSVAQAREPHFMDLLDKRFPRSDIPEPGRRQMLLMPLQYTPDLDYEPVPVLLFDRRQDPATIDLGYARLRSLSRMCNRFYLNMGVRSRLVVSLAQRGQLWGFFGCMSAGSHHLAYADRLAAQAFAETAALLLVEKEAAARHRDALDTKRRIGG
ncbi:MAG: GAF domain-containing protein, partial [Gammaproteobacteria bacterium]|nr:GAF domain-containing protein [Gammaproteobacteria bacterium]